jgi:hypothetical protein
MTPSGRPEPGGAVQEPGLHHPHHGGIQLAPVASDILGACGRALLEVPVGGERDPQALLEKGPRERSEAGTR